MANTEAYIPNASDSVIAYFGRNASGNLRCYCVRCNDASPLTDASKVYGDLYVAEPCEINRADTEEQCDVCGVTMRALSEACQREHDEQQARWSRKPITHVVEMGMVGDIRCRVY